jgi:invasion protein IalB
MRAGFVFAPARPARHLATCVAAAATLALGTSLALAQQPTPPAPSAPKQQPPKQPQQKSAPKQQPPAPQQPAQQPQPPAANGQQAAPQQLPPIVYSTWIKFCGKENQTPDSKEVCMTMKEAKLETGQFVGGAALIEQAGQDKKILRVTVPPMVALQPGTRMQLDKDPPLTGQYIICVQNGCIAETEVDAAFVAKLKKGQQIVLQFLNMNGQGIGIPLPLADFAKANEGPPSDPKKFEEDQKKLQDELQKKAEEARKRLQPTTPEKK